MVTKAFSIEDGNLNKAAIVTARSKLYSDIDLSFENKPSGDIYKKVDAAAVKQSVKNILLTNHGEKPFKPLFGANLRGLLFELSSPTLEEDLNAAIRVAIANHEPRAIVQRIIVRSQPDYNSIWVTVEFRIINTTETVSVEVDLTRLR